MLRYITHSFRKGMIQPRNHVICRPFLYSHLSNVPTIIPKKKEIHVFFGKRILSPEGGGDDDGDDYDCPICLSPVMVPTITNCCHCFCFHCIRIHLDRSNPKLCPICRTDITELFVEE